MTRDHGANLELKRRTSRRTGSIRDHYREARQVREPEFAPLAMPPALAAAHSALDRAVDKCYRPADFPSDRGRVEYLFQLYEQLTAPLAPTAKPKRARGSRN